jgi:integrase
MAKSNLLTQPEVDAAKTKGVYSDGGGLALFVTTPDRRHWRYRYRHNGRDREMSLGNADGVTLAMARQRHTIAKGKLAQGIDPLDERHPAKAAPEAPPAMPTFGTVADDYIAAHEPEWRSKVHRAQWRQTVGCANAVIGHRPVDQVGIDDVLAVLQPIWNQKPETASRLRGRIEVILDYARVRGWRDGPNPALWRGNLSLMLASPNKLRPTEHHAAMPWADCPAFVQRLLPVTGSMGARALAFAILTAARSGEVRAATWDEIDLKAALWTVPASRMKAAKQHRVPLSDAALAVLKPLAEFRQCPLVFPGPSLEPLSDMTLTAVLRRMGLGHLTAHGFRSSFRDWAADTGRSADAAEAALAHAPASKVVAAYARSDLLELRRGLMAEWASFLTAPPADVIPLPVRAAG